jgi:hypothetical protein
MLARDYCGVRVKDLVQRGSSPRLMSAMTTVGVAHLPIGCPPVWRGASARTRTVVRSERLPSRGPRFAWSSYRIADCGRLGAAAGSRVVFRSEPASPSTVYRLPSTCSANRSTCSTCTGWRRMKGRTWRMRAQAWSGVRPVLTR